MAAADGGERPGRAGVRRRPAPVEQAVDRKLPLVEDDVLGMRVADARERRHDGQRIHSLPEEVAWIEVGGEVVGDRGEPLERLRVVHARARMELDADHELGMLAARELGGLMPVGGGDAFRHWANRRILPRWSATPMVKVWQRSNKGELRSQAFNQQNYPTQHKNEWDQNWSGLP